MWAYYAAAKELHPKLFKKVADHINGLGNLNEFKPQELSITVWAYATAGESDAAIKQRDDFNSQDVTNFLWAYATNGQIERNLFVSLVPTVEANLSKCNEQGLANIAWAYAVANVDAPSVFNNEFIHACLQKRKMNSIV